MNRNIIFEEDTIQTTISNSIVKYIGIGIFTLLFINSVICIYSLIKMYL